MDDDERLFKEDKISGNEFFKIKSLKRIWSKINKKLDNECWNWKCGRSSSGYGSCWFMGKRLNPVRVIYESIYGLIPENMWILHSCDNPLCCNPNHLKLGTPKDNTEDMIKRKRNLYSDGRSKISKITPDDAKLILQLYNSGEYTQKDISLKFGYHVVTINKLLKKLLKNNLNNA